MNVVCTSDICPIALNSKCVFYESSALPNTGIATNDSVQVALQKIDATIASFVTVAGNPFPDNETLIKNSTDPTKLAIFSAASITTGTTRTYTLPNISGTVLAAASLGTQGQIAFAGATSGSIAFNSGFYYREPTLRTLVSGNTDITFTGVAASAGSFSIVVGENIAITQDHSWSAIFGDVYSIDAIFNNGLMAGTAHNISGGAIGSTTILGSGNVFSGAGLKTHNTISGSNNTFNTSGTSFANFITGTSNSLVGTTISNAFAAGQLSSVTADAALAFGYPIAAQSTRPIIASGVHAINMSANSSSQTLNHGAQANYSVIIGGQDHDIPSDSQRSVVIGGNAIKARATDPDNVYVPYFNITQITQDDALTDVLVRNSTTGKTYYRASTTFGWAVTGTTVLTGDVTIDGGGFVNGVAFDAMQYFRLTGGSQLSIISGNSTMSSSASAISLNNSVSGSGVNISEGRILITPGTSTLATLNLGQRTAEPSSFTNGDMWYNSTTNKFRARENGVSVDLIGGGGITNSAANTELMVSDGTNAIGSNLYMSGTGSTLTLSLGNSSYAGSNRLFGSAGSAAAVGLQIFSKGASELSLSGSPVVAQSNSTTLGAVITPFKVRTRSLGGVEVPGIGVAIAFETETDTANFEIGGIIESVSTNVTSTTEAFDLVFKTMTAGAAAVEKLRISGSQITISTATLRTIGPGNTSATDSLVVMDSDSHVIASFSNDENLNIGSGGTYASGPAGVVFMSNVDTAPVATPTSGVFIYSQDSGDTNATLAIYTEQAVEAIGTFTASNKLKIRINGVEYWIQLDAV